MLINPMMVEGQIQGGIAHGIGNALYEWMGYDDGRPAGDHDVRRLSDADRDRGADARDALPGDAARRSIRSASRASARPARFPAAAALISAVEDALTPFGVRIGQVPLTPGKIVQMIRAAGRGR